MRISEPGVYDLSESDYHADPVVAPSLSASIAKVLLGKSPRHAWYAHPRLNPAKAEDNRAMFDLGKAAHALVLGEERQFAIIDADDWRTKAAKEARDAAYAAGKTPLLAEQWGRVAAMADASRAQLAAHADARHAFTNGKPDATLVWQEGETWCRCRLDWLPNRGRIFYDLKSTESANPETWSRQLYALGYDIQAAFYRRAIRAVLGIEDPAFEFVVQEVQPPYALSVIGLPPGAVDMADRKVDAALDLWRWCLSNDKWPGYPARTCYAEIPAWAEAQWLDREARDNLTREAGDQALFQQLIDWQRPLTEKESHHDV